MQHILYFISIPSLIQIRKTFLTQHQGRALQHMKVWGNLEFLLHHTTWWRFHETSNSCFTRGRTWCVRWEHFSGFLRAWFDSPCPKQTHFSNETSQESTRLLKLGNFRGCMLKNEREKWWKTVSLPLRRMAALAGIIWSCMKPLVQLESINCSTSSDVNEVFSTIVSSTDRIWSPTDNAPHRSVSEREKIIRITWKFSFE